jgi:hypothetical protein
MIYYFWVMRIIGLVLSDFYLFSIYETTWNLVRFKRPVNYAAPVCYPMQYNIIYPSRTKQMRVEKNKSNLVLSLYTAGQEQVTQKWHMLELHILL